MQVVAKIYFVWTQKAEEKHPERVAGSPVWDRYKHKAPASMLESGDIVDLHDYEGQTDLFSFV
ncbi:hypothetical protein J2Z69_000760 [Paenibacillus shirakamiensis]|uniref:Uncharacterized protein n=1 Tax=Paenibacillus shirakamiensis TaxID=1265935 RepID=A0ABS4JF34_9BACL|nr:hypothetical protein [Paenibacillus shirakamiensis]MBP1999741.1 hypothetical protein [Paenibacillus shirakamiensis]